MPERLDIPRDSQGDTRLYGFRSRPDPTELPAGIARYLENMRCDEEVRVRAGTVALATDILLIAQPAVLDFVLPTEIEVASIARSGSTATVTTATAHGYSSGNIVAIEGADQADYNGDFVCTVTGASTFTYDLGGATPATPATGTIVCAVGVRIDDFPDGVRAACVYVENDLTQRVLLATGARAFVCSAGEASVEIGYPAGEQIEPTDSADLAVHLDRVYLFRGRATGDDLTISSITRAGATVTVTTSASHGLETGDWVRLLGQTDEAYRGVYQVTVTGAATYTFNIGAATPVSPASVAGICHPCKPVLVWDRDTSTDFAVVTTGTAPSTGHIRMPPADWAVAFNRQLILPYGRDEIIESGFGVDDDFDTLNGQLRIRPGGPDWLVAVHPAARTRYLVLYRHSLHRVQRNVTDLSIDDVDEVPAGVGCVARRSVVTCGEFIAWLSDRGVELARYVDQLNLISADRPLSAPIQDLINRINWEYAGRAVAVYHDNRLRLAVPLDDSTVNNRVLVFNFINQAAGSSVGEWESVDIFPGNFDIFAMLVLAYEGRQEVHYVTTLGGLYVADVGARDEYGAPGGIVGEYDIRAEVLGRRMLFGTLEVKRFTRAAVSVDLEAGAEMQVQVSTVNPDSDRLVRSEAAVAATNKQMRIPLRARGESGAIDLILTAGRPTIRAMMLHALVPGSDARDKE